MSKHLTLSPSPGQREEQGARSQAQTTQEEHSIGENMRLVAVLSDNCDTCQTPFKKGDLVIVGVVCEVAYVLEDGSIRVEEAAEGTVIVSHTQGAEWLDVNTASKRLSEMASQMPLQRRKKQEKCSQ